MSKALKNLVGHIANRLILLGVFNNDIHKLPVLKESTSFNAPEGTGFWYVGGNVASSPTPGTAVYGMLLQMRSPYSMHPQTNQAVYTQLFQNYTGQVYARSFVNGSWTAWRTL